DDGIARVEHELRIGNIGVDGAPDIALEREQVIAAAYGAGAGNGVVEVLQRGAGAGVAEHFAAAAQRHAATIAELQVGGIDLKGGGTVDRDAALRSADGVGDLGVLVVEDAARGRFQEAGIGNDVAGRDGERQTGLVGVDDAGGLVAQCELAVAGIPDDAVAGNRVVEVVERCGAEIGALALDSATHERDCAAACASDVAVERELGGGGIDQERGAASGEQDGVGTGGGTGAGPGNDVTLEVDDAAAAALEQAGVVEVAVDFERCTVTRREGPVVGQRAARG